MGNGDFTEGTLHLQKQASIHKRIERISHFIAVARCGTLNQPKPGSYEEAPRLWERKIYGAFGVAVTPVHKSTPGDRGHQQELVSILGSVWRESSHTFANAFPYMCNALFIWVLSAYVPISQLPETSNLGIGTVEETLHPFLL